MLCIETNTGLHQSCHFIDISLNEEMEQIGDIQPPMPYQSELLMQYDNDELIYHLYYCIKADLLTVSESSDSYITLIDDLTPKGHDFLAHIRPMKVWDKIKRVAEPVGALTVTHLTQIASEIVVTEIKSTLNL